MKIFYKKLSEEQIKDLSRSEIKKLQSKTGREIVDYIAKNIYKIENPEIIVENSKPKFLNSDIHFSITHSNRIVAVAFDKFPVGFDIEYIKDRDFAGLAKHYNITVTEKTGFYKKWTQIEAEIKIQSEIKQSLTELFDSEYMMSIVSSNPEELKFELTNLS